MFVFEAGGGSYHTKANLTKEGGKIICSDHA